MKATGIICEYNPFHNGHIYHLEKVKELNKDNCIILVMSSYFMQRGEVNILNKWDRTSIALKYGVDIVIELPFAFATQSADIFAYGAVSLLNHLKVDNLVFGTESNNVEMLKEIANIQESNQYNETVKCFLSEGLNYPTALSKALTKFNLSHIDDPNNLLGISYIKAINKLKSNIIPISIKRTNSYHNSDLESNIVSASTIRENLRKNVNMDFAVPNETKNKISKIISMEDYFPFLKYKILTENNLEKYKSVDEGLASKIKKEIIKSKSYNELIMNIKSKRYTYNRLSRMFTHILCNFTKEEADYIKEIDYIRILGFSKKGQTYLNQIKKDINIPVITNYKKNISKCLDLEIRATNVYSSIFNEEEKIRIIEDEYKKRPIIK